MYSMGKIKDDYITYSKVVQQEIMHVITDLNEKCRIIQHLIELVYHDHKS